MDWFCWLSKTGLHPSLVYEYGLSFSHNELEEEDIVFFNHEFLQSMGIAIAKHRLQILKLAAKNKGLINRSRPVSRFVLAIKRTKRSLAEYMRAFVHRQDSDLVIVNTRIRSGIGTKWEGGANETLKREETMMMGGAGAHGPMLHTNETHPLVVVPTPRIAGGVESLLSPMVFELQMEEETKMVGDDDDEDGCWLNGDEEFRWDAMFQDLNPT